MIPTTRLWALLALLALPMMAAGFYPGLGGLVLALDALVVGLAAVDFLLARRVRLEVHRNLPSKLSVGVANRVEVQLIHRSSQAVQVRVRDDVPEASPPTPEEAPLQLPAGEPDAVGVPGDADEARQVRALGTCTCGCRGRWGWCSTSGRSRWRETASVFPDLRGASRLLLSGAALDLVNLGLRQLRRDGRGSEFARLRDYAQGDSVREVDWKATARRGKPVTRVMESERSQSILICVDAGRSMAAQVDGLTKLDHAVNAALFLAFVAVRTGTGWGWWCSRTE